jgi:hypothetical protein
VDDVAVDEVEEVEPKPEPKEVEEENVDLPELEDRAPCHSHSIHTTTHKEIVCRDLAAYNNMKLEAGTRLRCTSRTANASNTSYMHTRWTPPTTKIEASVKVDASRH